MYGHVVTSHLSASHCYGSMSVDPPQHHLKTVNAKLCANFVDNTGLTYIDLLLTPMPGKLYPNFVMFVRTEVLASGIYRSKATSKQNIHCKIRHAFFMVSVVDISMLHTYYKTFMQWTLSQIIAIFIQVITCKYICMLFTKLHSVWCVIKKSCNFGSLRCTDVIASPSSHQ